MSAPGRCKGEHRMAQPEGTPVTAPGRPVNAALTVYLNGKFTIQRTTGVQRVAAQLVRALDRQAGGRWVLLCPPGPGFAGLERIVVRTVGPAGLPTALWEQTVLPWCARDGRLLNLAGAAPAFARRQVCLLHDAAVFDHPEAYRPLFVAWYRWLFRRLARRAERLLTVSQFSRGRLAQCLGVAASRLAVVPNGGDHLDSVEADDAALDRLGLRGSRYLLAVGSANPTKNQAALLQAFARMPEHGELRLVLAGGRNERVFAGAPDRDPPGVLRVGALDDGSLKAVYRHARGLVFPSRYEGFGLPPLEAMACGCPVAAARAASIPEVCGDAALYFDPDRIDELCAAMQRLDRDQPLRDALRAAGARRVAAFRWQASAAALLDALREPGAKDAAA